jgi:uncharacterized protein (DUF1800 family)
MLESFDPRKWTVFHAAHLLNRAGFGGTPDEIAALHKMGLQAAVNSLIAGEEDDDLFPPPELTTPEEWVARRQKLRQAESDMERRELQKQSRVEERRQLLALREWWLNRMRYSPYPLQEKMTLFWHGHFATSFEKVNLALFIWQQNETLRAGSLGNFRNLTKAVTRDPAMMRYLDTDKSSKEKPNENFSRELMELFTLGEGVRYTEQDVREGARAFAGYRIDPRDLQWIRAKRQADTGEKLFMGKRGNFSGDEVVDIICDQPECADFMARKFLKFFAVEEPSDRAVRALGAELRSSGYDVKPTLRALFTSAEFYSPAAMRSQVKSPVQWVVQSAKVLDTPMMSFKVLDPTLGQMGQTLFGPPNVKGWDGGRAWITSATLLLRCNLAGYMVNGRGVSGAKGKPGVNVQLEKIAPRDLRSDAGKLCDALAFRLMNDNLRAADRERLVEFVRERGAKASDSTIRDLLHLMMSTPEYQLT